MSCELCPECGRINRGYKLALDGDYVFSECGHFIPVDYMTVGQMAIAMMMSISPKEQRAMRSTIRA